MSSFACATLADAVLRALEMENAHERHYMAKSSVRAVVGIKDPGDRTKKVIAAEQAN